LESAANAKASASPKVETNQPIASMSTDEKMLRVADVVMDVQNHTVTRGEKQLILNRKELTDTSLSVL
jgi:hypothetical protein